MVSLRFLSVGALLLSACPGVLSSPAPPPPPKAPAPPKPKDTKKITYDFKITWANYAPDGYTRKMLLVNGKSPGPVIKAKEGDEIVVNVHNTASMNTSLHFHGIEMDGTPWSDGVPGVSQRSIQPNEKFSYKWKATQHGSHWYHAHTLGQIEDGFYGAIIIQPADKRETPFHMIGSSGAYEKKAEKDKRVKDLKKAEKETKPLIVQDHLHITSEKKWEYTLASGIEGSCYDSLLFNGKGRVVCLGDEIEKNVTPVQRYFLGLQWKMTDKACLPADALDAQVGGQGDGSKWPKGTFDGCKATNSELEKFKVKGKPDGEWISFDIIGAINFITTSVSIDEHDMWVYAVDGSYIIPQKVQALVMTNGDRYSVFVKTKKAGDFKIRVNANSIPQIIGGHAILTVEPEPKDKQKPVVKDSKPYITLVGAPVDNNVKFFDGPSAVPYPADPIPKKADALFRLDMFADGASYLWAMNGSRLMPEELEHRATPFLFKPDPKASNNVTITTKNNTWVDLVFHAAQAPMPPHPIHKHGNKMYQLGSGVGEWKWDSLEDAMEELGDGAFNLENPPRRDGFATPAAELSQAWTVVRYHVTNPGAWLLHCHVSNHLSGGMMVVVQDGVDKWPKAPKEYQDFEKHGKPWK